MKDYFIFTYRDKGSFKGGIKTITVLFIPESSIKKSALIQGLETYNQENVLSDKFVVVLPEYASEALVNLFEKDVLISFGRVVGFDKNYSETNYSVYKFDLNGKLNKKFGVLKDLKNRTLFLAKLFKNGNFHIFDSKSGLIESNPDHHFVFPSGKHSEKFIRTANVLRDSNEIFFIAIQLLEKFSAVEIVYCDTASINVLPFAVFEIQNRFERKFETRVKSFESYKVFEDYNQSFNPNSLVLISSSTSGNIIDRLNDKQIADSSNILVLFFLGNDESYKKHKTNIFCNLTKSSEFEQGYNPFKTFKNSLKCKLCINHSQPVVIQSDVFLNIEPKYNVVTFKKSDAPSFLSKFIENHRALDQKSNIFKVHFRDIEEEDSSYEIYIDFTQLLDNFENKNYPQYYHEKLEKTINAHIPINTRYLLPLRDPGSKALTEKILNENSWVIEPTIIDINNPKISTTVTGTIVVVGATYVTGRHYFFINRLLRDFPKLTVVYFIGLARSISKQFSENIKSNLGIGEYGGRTYPVINVDEIFIPQAKVDNSWSKEWGFIRELLGKVNSKSALYKFFENRRNVLFNAREEKGLCDNVFLPTLSGEKLSLRKGFVYWNFEVKTDIAYQSQVYFTITSVINRLRNEPLNSERSLKQSTYVRNLISSETFNRFNDGVIQASILRAADYRMLSYDLDENQSLAMSVFMKSLVDKFEQDHGEALPEFMMALGLKKLRLKRIDLNDFLDYSSKNLPEKSIGHDFVNYLKGKLL
ncbi:Putative phage-like protein [Croceitalea dokdonensis DOKDO 023]|uniref:Putative phage-like protein n=1 Tax=Croceitalea dokdonensis DOKDO 023 TaxID=1300341 RepID=A0A0P7B431_9FLAO|nr:hypothetical protein [Croceitalea dokdonensis]KPM33421.1 Putative phage-like protein [Croceitalea dokdonensis DOKDO 023]